MTSPPVCAAPEDTVDDCMRLMTSKRIRHLPVADGDSIVGLVSIGDLVNWIISAQAETIGHCTATLPVRIRGRVILRRPSLF
jgi:predicted transcriptional regulator